MRFLPALSSITMISAVSFTVSLPLLSQGPIVSQDTLIGWAAPAAPSTVGTLDVQSTQKCPPATRVCPQILGQPQFSWAGGTAYDPRHQSVWVSDGAVLVEYQINGCKALCKQTPTLVLTSPVAKSSVTGLAISDRRSLLFQLEMISGNLAIVTYNNKNCPPLPISSCKMSMGGRDIAAGLAYDETRELLYFTISSLQASTNTWQTVLYQAPYNKPCNPTCKWVIPTKCSTLPVNGLTYDACSDMIYATDGQMTSQIQVVDPKACKFSLVACCKKQLTGDWRGLAVIPEWSIKRVGRPCIGKPCAACNNMVHLLAGGDSSLGNPDFALTLSNAPANQIGVCYIKIGTAGPPIQPPFLCGPFYAFPPAIFVVQVLPGALPCGGLGNVPLPIPNTQKLCGLTLTSQWLVVCTQGSAFGFSLSNAVEFTLASS